MSEFSRELHLPESMDSFRKHIPIEWISEAVNQTGRAAIRKRRFPPEQAVWLIFGIGLMRNRSISDVCDKLALPSLTPKLATSSIVKARQRIGYEPLRYLFHTTASKRKTEESSDLICGLKLMSVDGTQFKTLETKDNQKRGLCDCKVMFSSVLAATFMSTRTYLRYRWQARLVLIPEPKGDLK